MPKYLKRFLVGIIILYISLCGIVYFVQEKLIFFPEQIDLQYAFKFEEPFEEHFIATDDGIQLNLLHFKAQQSCGAVLHFHGNAGSIKSWGANAKVYTELGYDYFLYDYRGFGKSEGSISSQRELVHDAELVFEFVQQKFPADKIILEGFSIGTGIAAQVAAKHSVRQLLLLAPYKSLSALSFDKFPFLPSFILKYTLKTDEVLPKIKSPITILHGTADEVIPFSNSEELKELFKSGDQLIEVEGYHHNDLFNSADYQNYLRSL